MLNFGEIGGESGRGINSRLENELRKPSLSLLFSLVHTHRVVQQLTPRAPSAHAVGGEKPFLFFRPPSIFPGLPVRKFTAYIGLLAREKVNIFFAIVENEPCLSEAELGTVRG